MFVFRLSKRNHAEDLIGTGAKLYGGRWNHKNIPVVYTAESRALAVDEVLVHLRPKTVPVDYVMVTIQIPDKISLQEVKIRDLPSVWNKFPSPWELRNIGSDWIKSKRSLILKVPSAVIDGDYNILINPEHSDITKVKIKDIKDFEFDSRLLK